MELLDQLWNMYLLIAEERYNDRHKERSTKLSLNRIKKFEKVIDEIIEENKDEYKKYMQHKRTGLIRPEELRSKIKYMIIIEMKIYCDSYDLAEQRITNQARYRFRRHMAKKGYKRFVESVKYDNKKKNEYIKKFVKPRKKIRVDKKKCELCGSKKRLIKDHIIPVSDGGKDDKSNLQILCSKCHRLKTMNEHSKRWRKMRERNRIVE